MGPPELIVNPTQQPARTAKLVSLGTSTLIDHDVVVKLPNGHTVLCFKKGVVPTQMCDKMYPIARKVAKRSRARATAAGPLRASTIARVKAHPHLKQVSSYAYVQNRPGMGPGGRQYTSSVTSGTAGWVTNSIVTRYTFDNFYKGYQELLELAAVVDKAYAKALPSRHNAQAKDLCNRPRMSPAFSTMAANYNFRTAVHKDNKTMPGSMLVFTLLGDDKAKGGYLKFPELNIAVDLRKGDMLAFDAELLHGNTPFTNKLFDRLSCVFYDKVPI